MITVQIRLRDISCNFPQKRTLRVTNGSILAARIWILSILTRVSKKLHTNDLSNCNTYLNIFSASFQVSHIKVIYYIARLCEWYNTKQLIANVVANFNDEIDRKRAHGYTIKSIIFLQGNSKSYEVRLPHLIAKKVFGMIMIAFLLSS